MAAHPSTEESGQTPPHGGMQGSMRTTSRSPHRPRGRGRALPLGAYVAGFFSSLVLLGWVAAQGSTAPAELRARRLVIEDAEGRPRIVLDADLGALEGRLREDPASGVLVLDENGVDRVVLGSPTTAPQIQGRLNRRLGPSTGMVFNDGQGDERGGLGVLDHDGRAVLGLDRASGEGLALFVTPQHSGLMISAGTGGARNQRVFLGTNIESDTTVLSLDDGQRQRRFRLVLEPEQQARMEFLDADADVVAGYPEPRGDGEAGSEKD